MGKKAGQKPTPRGVTTRQTGKGETIYINFTYQGVFCREPLSGWPVDKSNIKAAENLRGEIYNKISNGTFKYADYFPNSKKLMLFGQARTDASISFYLDKALDNAKARGLKVSSIATYKSRADDLKERIGKLSVKAIDTAYLRDLSVELHKTMSFTSIDNTFKPLRQALAEAVIDKVIQFNPFSEFSLSKYVAKPKKKDRQEKVNPFNHSELTAMIKACDSEEEQLTIQAWAKCGFRTGELCALQWHNVNLRRGYIRITENYVTMVRQQDTPKTESSERDIYLDDEAEEIIKRLRLLTKIKGDIVFRNNNAYNHGNGQYDSYSLERLFRRICKKAKVNYRRPYNMRHTYATIRISLGHNLWDIAEQMGHKSPDMLFSTYGGYIREYAELQAEKREKSHTDHTLENKERIFSS